MDEPIRGDWVVVHFWDHQEDGEGLLQCSVHGKLEEIGADFVQVHSWYSDCDISTGTHKWWNIARALITGIEKVTSTARVSL